MGHISYQPHKITQVKRAPNFIKIQLSMRNNYTGELYLMPLCLPNLWSESSLRENKGSFTMQQFQFSSADSSVVDKRTFLVPIKGSTNT